MASAEGWQAEKYPKVDYSKTITVLAGEEKRSFTVYKLTICEISPFLESALRGEWAEAKENTVPLPDVEPEVFEAYAHYAYTSRIYFEHLMTPEGINGEELYLFLSKFWIFADAMLSPELCNHLIDTTLSVFEVGRRCPLPATLQSVWNKTSADSKLRALHTDIISSTLTEEEFEEHSVAYQQELMLHLAKAFLGRREPIVLPSKRNDIDSRCRRYHIHENGVRCGY